MRCDALSNAGMKPKPSNTPSLIPPEHQLHKAEGLFR